MSIELQPTHPLGDGPVSRSDTSPIPEHLATWERYAIKRRLGSGGMGEVFQAWDPRLGRFVALKFLAGTEQATLERFEREARAQARVDHPAICKVFEVGEVAGRRYIAMQEIRGVTLDRVAPLLSLEQKVSLVREVAEAIHAAHRSGLIHRDLKPGNILVERSEEQKDGGEYRPFIVDFGLARDQQSPGATIAGTIAGTVGYMSPEQARGRVEEIDRRTDVYNLGLILYELLASRPAFEFDGMLDSLVRLQSDDAPPPRRFNRSIPVDLETIVLKALERHPGRRYPSAHAMAEDLRRFLEGEPIVARRSTLLYRLRTRIRKHRLIAAVIATALLLLIGAGAWALRERWRADARAEIAQRFGMEIKELDLLARVAVMLPPDRAVPLHTLLQPRMERIVRQMNESGPLASGPGSLALARGAIALGDYRGAWNRLDDVRRSGYDTPDVHYARSQVLGHFYEEALTRAAMIPEEELRKAALATAVRTYRTPSIDELHRAGNATTAAPELIRAQLALREERLDDAIAAARAASSASPWLYEAIVVEVNALRTRARGLSVAGRFDDAAVVFGQARERLKVALAIARGDPRLHYEDCRLRYQTIGNVRFQRRLTGEDAVEAAAPCAVSTRLDPTLAGAWTMRGAIHGIIAEDQLRHGENPAAQAGEAIGAMRKATALDPRDGAALAGIGRAEITLARWGIPRGIDPRQHLETGRQSLEHAVRVDPASTNYRLALANALLTRGEYEHRIGNDSREWLLRAIGQGRRALAYDPDVFLIHNLLGNTYNVLADRELLRGGDPRPALTEAAKAFDRAMTMNPSNSSLINNHGNTWLTMAEYLAGRGEPIDEPASKAIARYRRAVELRPDYSLAFINIGYTNRLLALDRVRRGRDPMTALHDARQALDRYDAANPGDVDSLIERARAAVVEARWLLRSGADPRPALAAAERVAAEVLSIDGDSTTAMLLRAEIKRWEAERRTSPDVLAAFRERIASVRARDPQNAEAMALEGSLLLLDARTRYPESAATLAASGAALIEEALRAKPSLRPDYGPARQ